MTVAIQRVGSVVVVIARGELSMADADEVMSCFDEAYRSGQRYAVLLDGRGVASPTPDVRRRLSESPGTAEEIAADRGQHTVVILDSSILRGVLTAIRWFLPKAVQLRAASDAAEACVLLGKVGHPRSAADVATLTALAQTIDADRTAGQGG